MPGWVPSVVTLYCSIKRKVEVNLYLEEVQLIYYVQYCVFYTVFFKIRKNKAQAAFDQKLPITASVVALPVIHLHTPGSSGCTCVMLVYCRFRVHVCNVDVCIRLNGASEMQSHALKIRSSPFLSSKRRPLA